MMKKTYEVLRPNTVLNIGDKKDLKKGDAFEALENETIKGLLKHKIIGLKTIKKETRKK